MIQDLKRFFRKLTPLEMATRELAEAQLQLLEAETAVEYSKSVVSYNVERIVRLKAYVANNTHQ
jgi:hypothetical protein